MSEREKVEKMEIICLCRKSQGKCLQYNKWVHGF